MTSQQISIEISKAIISLTPWLETPNDPVQYHEAEAKLEAWLFALAISYAIEHPDIIVGEHYFARYKDTVIRFLHHHHWSYKNHDELPIQLLSSIGYQL